MATVLQLGDIVEVKLGCYDLALGQVTINVLHYYVGTVAALGVTDADFADDLQPAFRAAYRAVLSPQSTWHGVRVQKIWPLPVAMAWVDASNPSIGVFGSVPAPAQLSPVITKQTAGAGRSKRGRFYVGLPPIEAVNPDGTPDPAYNTALLPLANLLDDVWNVIELGGQAQLVSCIYNRDTHAVSQVLNRRINDKFGTQRRRGVYGRQNVIPPF
nr:unnamed protein product [uncultured bacterium]